MDIIKENRKIFIIIIIISAILAMLPSLAIMTFSYSKSSKVINQESMKIIEVETQIDNNEN